MQISRGNLTERRNRPTDQQNRHTGSKESYTSKTIENIYYLVSLPAAKSALELEALVDDNLVRAQVALQQQKKRLLRSYQLKNEVRYVIVHE